MTEVNGNANGGKAIRHGTPKNGVIGYDKAWSLPRQEPLSSIQNTKGKDQRSVS